MTGACHAIDPRLIELGAEFATAGDDGLTFGFAGAVYRVVS
jgi:hypothetical protein